MAYCQYSRENAITLSDGFAQVAFQHPPLAPSTYCMSQRHNPDIKRFGVGENDSSTTETTYVQFNTSRAVVVKCIG